MASLSNDGNGFRRIQVIDRFGARRAIRLGKCIAEQGEWFRQQIERIISDDTLGKPHDADLNEWLQGLSEKMLRRMRAAGVTHVVGKGIIRTTLREFAEKSVALMDPNAWVFKLNNQTLCCLERFLGPTKILQAISPSDAIAWRSWMIHGEGYTQLVVERRTGAAYRMWQAAIQWNMCFNNPFSCVTHIR